MPHAFYITRNPKGRACFWFILFIKSMQREMTVGYQNRYGKPCGCNGAYSHDLPSAPKLVIANHFLKKLSGFSIGEKVQVTYSAGSITISKLT